MRSLGTLPTQRSRLPLVALPHHDRDNRSPGQRFSRQRTHQIVKALFIDHAPHAEQHDRALWERQFIAQRLHPRGVGPQRRRIDTIENQVEFVRVSPQGDHCIAQRFAIGCQQPGLAHGKASHCPEKRILARHLCIRSGYRDDQGNPQPPRRHRGNKAVGQEPVCMQHIRLPLRRLAQERGDARGKEGWTERVGIEPQRQVRLH